MVDSSAFARVARHRERRLFYKEFLPRSPLESIKARLRGSRATRARRNNETLRDAGFDAPASVAWGSLSGGHEYLFSREVPGEGIDHWLGASSEPGSTLDLQSRRDLLRALGEFVGRLHASGVVHGDLRPGTVLASHNGERWQFGLIDNESNRRGDPPPGRRLLRNLMQLNMLPLEILSRTDRMRFLCAWRQQMPGLSPLEAKILAAEAYLWAMRRLAEKQR